MSRESAVAGLLAVILSRTGCGEGRSVTGSVAKATVTSREPARAEVRILISVSACTPTRFEE